MAKNNLEDDLNQSEGAQPGMPLKVSAAPSSTATGTASSTAPSQPGQGSANPGLAANQGGGASSQPQGTGFINLQQMLDANRTSAAGMDHTLANQGYSLANQFNNDLSSAQNQYGKDVAGGTGKTQYGSGPAPAGGGSAYSGPMSMGSDPNVDMGKLSSEAQAASSYNRNLGNFNGLQADIQSVYGKNGMQETQGGGMMDAFLAGAAQPRDAKGNGMFGQMANQFGNLGQTLASADQASQAPAQKAAQVPAYQQIQSKPQAYGSTPQNPGYTPGNAKNWVTGNPKNNYRTYGAY